MTTLTHDQLAAIAREHGDAFFVADLDRFAQNFHGMRDAFRSHYPSTNIAYSYKTNYLPRLCTLVNSWGGYAEVVSGLEYDMARAFGVDPADIVFNGPYKTAPDIARALSEGALVNLDGPRQLRLLEDVLGELDLDQAARIGVRTTFSLESSKPSRFGFDATDVPDVVARLAERSDVVVEGLHCHFATGTRDTAAYRTITTTMLELADRCFGDDPPRWIDTGGGFYSSMPDELRRQFGGPVPSYEEYAEAVAGTVADHYGTDGSPELVIEPGVSVTADVMDFACEVLEVRTVNDRGIALVSGSIHVIKPTLNDMNMPLSIVGTDDGPDTAGVDGPIDLVGYTCMEHDVLYRGFDGPIATGDVAVFSNVGAYTNVLKPPFIRAAPPIVALNADGGIECLRRAESMDDVLATYAR